MGEALVVDIGRGKDGCRIRAVKLICNRGWAYWRGHHRAKSKEERHEHFETSGVNSRLI